MQILIWVMMIVGGAAGLLSTAYLVLAMPIILVWKIFRKVKYHMQDFGICFVKLLCWTRRTYAILL